MRKKKVIELKGRISTAVAQDIIPRGFAVDIMNKLDEILALPLDVPSDDEIEDHLWEEITVPLSNMDRLNNTPAYQIYKETFLWIRWMRDVIIQRNK
jgi:hypothetical protein